MWDCQHGVEKGNGFWTGSVCKNRAQCRAEGRCYFVWRVELYRERHGGMPTGECVPPPPSTPPGRAKRQRRLPGLEAA
jgi:hypothetical protein